MKNLMQVDIQTIDLKGVNCYLVRTSTGFILIDTGGGTFSNGSLSSIRAALEQKLESAGCRPGNLSLIVVTHGHYDHTANCAYLREKYNTRIAMHRADVDMVLNGSMITVNRKFRPGIIRFLVMAVMFFNQAREKELLTGFETFKPDLLIDEGFQLAEFGWDAEVLHLPGHSPGSIGILTSGGDLFCGDVLYKNSKIKGKPPFTPQMADVSLDDADTSIERLKKLPIKTVYPGHGSPFPMDLLL